MAEDWSRVHQDLASSQGRWKQQCYLLLCLSDPQAYFISKKLHSLLLFSTCFSKMLNICIYRIGPMALNKMTVLLIRVLRSTEKASGYTPLRWWILHNEGEKKGVWQTPDTQSQACGAPFQLPGKWLSQSCNFKPYDSFMHPLQHTFWCIAVKWEVLILSFCTCLFKYERLIHVSLEKIPVYLIKGD